MLNKEFFIVSKNQERNKTLTGSDRIIFPSTTTEYFQLSFALFRTVEEVFLKSFTAKLDFNLEKKATAPHKSKIKIVTASAPRVRITWAN